MKLTEFCNKIYADKSMTLYQRAIQLQTEHARLVSAFELFGKRLKSCGADPQFWSETVLVGLQDMKRGIIALNVLGSKELRLCFDAIRSDNGVGGKVTCYCAPLHRDGAIDNKETKWNEVASWTFESNGDTDLSPPGFNGSLSMGTVKEAVAIVTLLILAAHSEKAD